MIRRGVSSAVLLLVVSACSGDPEPPPADPTAGTRSDEITQEDFAAVQDVLDRRARALRRGDRTAFLAGLDPGNKRLRRAQLAFFDNVQRLPLTRLYYGTTASGLPAGDIEGDDPTLRPGVFEHVQLDGALAKPVSNPVAMTFVERDGRWLLGGERLDRDTPPQARPWFGDPIEVARDGDLVVMTDRDAEVGAEELLDSTREALAGVGAVLGEPADPPLLVDGTSNGLTTTIAIGSDEEAGAVAFTAVATGPDGEESRGVAGAVVQANPTTVEQLVADERTLRHEMVHVLLDGYGDTNPKWVTEGIAEYAAYDPSLLEASGFTDPEPAARLARILARRPVELTPVYAWGDQPELDYLLAHASAEHLIEGYGMERYREMMDVFKRRSRAEGVPYGDGIVDDVLRRVYDLGADEVARAAHDLAVGITD